MKNKILKISIVFLISAMILNNFSNIIAVNENNNNNSDELSEIVNNEDLKQTEENTFDSTYQESQEKDEDLTVYDDSAVVVATATTSDDPNGLSFNIKDKSNRIFDITKGFVLTDHEDMFIGIAYQSGIGHVDNLVTIVLPDFYSFSTIPVNSEYYSSYQLSDFNGGKNNKLVLSMMNPSDITNPPTWAFDIPIKLNKNSLTDTEIKSWREGIWDPNTEDKKTVFQILYNDKLIFANRMKILTKVYTGVKSSVLTIGKSSLNNIALSEVGKNEFQFSFVNANGYNWLNETIVAISYSYADVYTYGAVDTSEMKFHVDIPNEYEIVEWIPTNSASTSGYKNMKNSTNCIIQEDKQSADFIVNDDGTDVNARRVIASLHIQPKEKFRLYNPDKGVWSVDNPDGCFMPANAVYPILIQVSDKQDNSITMQGSCTITVSNYIIRNNAIIIPRGTTAIDTNHLILAEVEPDKKHQTANITKINNMLTQNIEPNYDGAGMKFIANFDERLQVSDFTYTNKIDKSNKASESDLKSVTYKTKQGKTIPVDISNVNKNEQNLAKANLEEGDYIVEIEFVYNKFAQSSLSPIVRIDYKVTENNKGIDWSGKEEIPISYKLIKNDETILSENVNYIRIKTDVCPTFKIVASSGKVGLDHYSKVGNYSPESTSFIAGGIELTNNFLGGTSGVVDSLDHPVFQFGNSAFSKDKIKFAPLGNGIIHLNSIMSDGNWTLRVVTQTAERAKAGLPTQEHTFALPAFDEDTKTLNLYDSTQFYNALKANEFIGKMEFSYDGILDISSMSNQVGEDGEVTKVNKVFLTVEKDYKTIDPLTGLYFASVTSENGAATSSGFSRISVSYENCRHINELHLTKNGGEKFDNSAYLTYMKGAEIITPTSATKTTFEGTLQQGVTSTITANIGLDANISKNAELHSSGGETVYFNLNNEALKYLSFSNIYFDGMKAEYEITKIDGNNFLKITNPDRPTYQKKSTLYANNSNRATFEPYVITMDVSAVPMTPTENLEIFSAYNNQNKKGSWLEFGKNQTTTFEKNGKIVRTVISGEGSYGFTGSAQEVTWVKNYGLLYDDCLNLYTDTPATERHWMLGLNKWSTPILTSTSQGVVLNPGINDLYDNSHTTVYPWQNNNLTTAITLLAGADQNGMRELQSTIKIPRVNDTVVDNSTGENVIKTTTTDLYLSGPIEQVIDYKNSTSTAPIIKYSIDEGNSFVDENQITDWSQVTHVSIFVDKIAANDGTQLKISLNAKADEEDEGAFGDAYMEAIFSTSNIESQSNRLNYYEFKGYTISGVVWDDANADGVVNTDETKRQEKVSLYKNYNTINEELIATVESDPISGFYEFKNVLEYKNLTAVIALPSQKTATIISSSTDNKYVVNGKGETIHQFPSEINSQQIKLDCGLRDLIPITIGGDDDTTALSGMKTLNGTKKNIDIKNEQFEFLIEAATSNPINGTKNIPNSIKNGDVNENGAELNFTGQLGWTFTKEGTYHFILKEKDTGLKGYGYDTSQYAVKVVVSEEINRDGISTGYLQQVTTIEKSNANVSKDNINFENIAKSYQVHYDVNGGDPNAIISKIGVNWEDDNLLPTTNLVRAGYIFEGWEIKNKNRNVSNTDTYATLVDNDDSINEITLSAKWKKKEFTINWISENNEYGTISPENETENVQYKSFATKDISAVGNTIADQWSFVGWEYNYLPDGMEDLPENYIKGVVQNYKQVEILGDVTFVAKFTKQPFVNVSANHGYVAIDKGNDIPILPDNDEDKKLSDKIEFSQMSDRGESVSVAYANHVHYHLSKVTVSDLYGNTKVIYMKDNSEKEDTEFKMNDSTLHVSFNDKGSLQISNIKNSLNIQFEFKEDTKYKVNFYVKDKDNVDTDTIPYATNSGLYTNDKFGTPPKDPQREGYHFIGWSYDGVNVNYDKDDTIKNSDVNVYAIWGQKVYEVNYNLNGGMYQNLPIINPLKTNYHSDSLLPKKAPDKTGYRFKGWYFNSEKIDNKTKYKDLVADDTVDKITLNALWENNDYVVSFDKNADDAIGVMRDQDFKYDVEQELSSNEFTRDGYTFIGWSSSEDGLVEFYDKNSVKNLTVDDNGVVKLYALWNANGDTNYKIEHYKQNEDGEFILSENDIVMAKGQTDSIANASIKTQSNIGFEKYIFDQSNTNNILAGTIKADGSLVLKVYYKRVETVSFDVNGGTPHIDDQDVIYGESLQRPEDPVKDGYKFVGWIHGNENEEWNFSQDKVTNSFTLQAKWEKIDNGKFVDTNDQSNYFVYMKLIVISLGIIILLLRKRRNQLFETK